MTSGRLLILTDISLIAPILGTCAVICGILLLMLLAYLCQSREGLPLIRLFSISAVSLFTMSLVFCLVAYLLPIGEGSVAEVLCLCLSDISWSLGTRATS